MRFFQIIIASALLISTLISLSFAQTHVSGVVSGTWWAEGNPYIADSSLYIPQDSSLIIMPGVELQFGTYNDFLVDGEIYVFGSPDDSVKFRNYEGYPSWGCDITLTDFCSDNSFSLQQCF